jgi:hypothetical protein
VLGLAEDKVEGRTVRGGFRDEVVWLLYWEMGFGGKEDLLSLERSLCSFNRLWGEKRDRLLFLAKT